MCPKDAEVKPLYSNFRIITAISWVSEHLGVLRYFTPLNVREKKMKLFWKQILYANILLERGIIYEPRHEKTCFLPYANNKGADQPAHPRSLISAFVIHCLDSIIPLLAIAEIWTLASLCSWAVWFESYLVANPKDRFSRNVAHMSRSWFIFLEFSLPEKQV